jgi:predicted ATPase
MELKRSAEAAEDDTDAEAINRATKYYLLPLTSEFLGESMLALESLLARSPLWLSREQASQARRYVDSIRSQWFSRPRKSTLKQ